MTSLAAALLRLSHSVFSFFISLRAFWNSLRSPVPKPLEGKRERIPTHLAIILVGRTDTLQDTEKVFIDSVKKAINFCRTVGIARLTVYDSEGILVNCAEEIRGRLASSHSDADCEESESDVKYPLTPPPSDYSESRSLSPEFSISNVALGVVAIAFGALHQPAKPKLPSIGAKRLRRRSMKHSTDLLILNLVSREASKLAIASAGNFFAQSHSQRPGHNYSKFHLSVQDLNSVLEGKHGLSSPEFLIIHSISPSLYPEAPLELHGFPPWQIRLTEIYYNRHRKHRTHLDLGNMWQWSRRPAVPLNEVDFRQALDDFSRAEMRFGK